jgi:FecR protein/SPOR domain
MMLRHPIASTLAALALGTTGAAMAQSVSKSKPPRSAPLAIVETVQLSASVLRGGVSTPLAPGMELGSRDQVRTGPQSRVVLRTADGSTVKLGEQGSFFLDNARMRDDNVFEAAMRMAEGAFRFTTEALEKFGGRREVNITVKTVTAGIRGTDLWGKSTSDSQIVCLIAGTIEVTSPGERPFTMDQPLSFYVLEGDLSRAIATVPPGQFQEWAAETETQPGRGVSRRGGKWKIAIAPTEKHNDALRIYDELRKAGYPAEIVPSKVGEKRVYGVRLSNFETKQDAEFVADSLKRKAGFARYDYKVAM